MKTIDIVNAYNALGSAKLSKMEDKDKFTLIRAMKVLKPVSTGYEDFVKDARDRLKDDRWDDMQQQAERWNAIHKGQKLADLTPKEQEQLEDINAYFNGYTRRVEECVREEAEKDVAPEYVRLSEEAFGRLLESNPDWEVEKVMLVSEALCG